MTLVPGTKLGHSRFTLQLGPEETAHRHHSGSEQFER